MSKRKSTHMTSSDVEIRMAGDSQHSIYCRIQSRCYTAPEVFSYERNMDFLECWTSSIIQKSDSFNSPDLQHKPPLPRPKKKPYTSNKKPKPQKTDSTASYRWYTAAEIFRFASDSAISRYRPNRRDAKDGDFGRLSEVGSNRADFTR